MKENEKKVKIKKVIVIVVCSVVGFVLILGASAYLFVHSYISKMNLTDLAEEETAYAGDSIYEEGSLIDKEDVEYDSDKAVEAGATGNSGNSFPGTGEMTSEDEVISLSGFSDDEDADSDAEDIEELEEEVSKYLSDSSIPIMEDSKIINILLIGSDTRNEKERGLSDSMILISINKTSEKITATSLLRDIYLEIPGKQNDRLNTAFASGGAKLLMETIEQNFKIKIDKYIAIDFMAFIDIVDAVGGVTIEVTEEELPIVNRYITEINNMLSINKNQDHLTDAGIQLLNGKQALSYSRVRYVGTDFGRTERQRRVLGLMFEKIKGLNMSGINDLLQLVLPQVTTNFKEGEIFSQILMIPDYLKYDYEQWSIPMKGTYKDLTIRGMSVLGIDFEENTLELHRRVYLTD